MERTVTRRTVLATVGMGTTVSLAGCNTFDDDGTGTAGDDADDAENGDDTDDGENGSEAENGTSDEESVAPTETVLVIEAGQRQSLASGIAHAYTGVEIHPSGRLQFEPDAALTLEG